MSKKLLKILTIITILGETVFPIVMMYLEDFPYEQKTLLFFILLWIGLGVLTLFYLFRSMYIFKVKKTIKKKWLFWILPIPFIVFNLYLFSTVIYLAYDNIFNEDLIGFITVFVLGMTVTLLILDLFITKKKIVVFNKGLKLKAELEEIGK